MIKIELQDAAHKNLVEFNITGDKESYRPGSVEYRFMDNEVFNLFTHCFEQSNKLFDYYEPTRYDARSLVPLKNELTKNLNRLGEIGNWDDFKDFVMGLFLGEVFLEEMHKSDHAWFEKWEEYLDRIKQTNMDILALVDKCINEAKILWVKGY